MFRYERNVLRRIHQFPVQGIDGYAAVHFVHIERKKYHSELKRLSKAYVRNVDSFCREVPESKAHLDKPNLHRLIELYEHSMPFLGHVREFMELVFDGAHQPLKRCIAHSNNRNAHIFATEHCVANDWQGRISTLSRILQEDDSTKQLHARRGLRRFFIGEEAETLKESEHKDFITATDMVIRKMFTNAVQRRFNADNRISNIASTKTSSWRARTRLSKHDLSRIIGLPVTETKQVIGTAIHWINAVYPHLFAHEDGAKTNITLYLSAKRMRVTNEGRQTGSPRGFDVITSNCVVRAFIDDKKTENMILETTSVQGAVPIFFVVAAILLQTDDNTWVVCSKCKFIPAAAHQGYIQTERALNEQSFQILLLTADVRRAVYHICQDRDTQNVCTLDFEKKPITHEKEPLHGARMHFQTR